MSRPLLATLLLLAAVPPPPAVPADPRGSELRRAAREGDLALLRRLLRGGADPDAADAHGLTAMVSAAAAGRTAAVRELVRAGADPDLRHRLWGTALDAAARHGHAEVVLVLREAGARGSGRSAGDRVCVRPWGGEGYCGRVEEVRGGLYRVRLEHLVGCADGCPPTICSGGRPVGGATPSALGLGEVLEVRGECLTDVSVRSWPAGPRP